MLIGIDDTDIEGARGTNHLARALVDRLGFSAGPAIVARHQLLFDERIPYTSGNGSASIALPDADPVRAAEIAAGARAALREWFIEGSDPGLAVATSIPAEVVAFARRCQREIVTQAEARAVAARAAIHLEGLGGTEGGVIGALAAVGLASTGDDGRVVHLAGWPWPDDLRGVVSRAELAARGIDRLRSNDSGEEVDADAVDVGKRLRPNLRGGEVVLLVERAEDGGWRAVRVK
jgi:hypothetical protein